MQCFDHNRQFSTSPYNGPSAALTSTPAVASNGSKASKASKVRHKRAQPRTTEHLYRRKSELIAGTIGAVSAECSGLGSISSSSLAGLRGGARCASLPLPENTFYRYEHVFSIKDKIKPSLPPRQRQAESAHIPLSMPLGFAVAPGGSVSAFEIALGLVEGSNGAGQVSTINTPALTLQCSENEDGRSTREVSQSFIAGMPSQCSDIDLFLASLNASQSDPLAMSGLDLMATLTNDYGSIGAGLVLSSSISPTAIANSKPVSKKRGHEDSDQVAKRLKYEFKCTYLGCGKAFTKRCNLTSHQLTHTEERQFSCNFCQLHFHRKHDLNRHTKTHTGDRPFVCTRCNRGFARADALRRHTSKGSSCKSTAGGSPNAHLAETPAVDLNTVVADLTALGLWPII
ncbi:hypothetical protein GGI24_001055 [Coemansia furcata]|nr:hypothetical protein GGI24_001055 [Coemansia furcata]